MPEKGKVIADLRLQEQYLRVLEEIIPMPVHPIIHRLMSWQKHVLNGQLNGRLYFPLIRSLISSGVTVP